MDTSSDEQDDDDGDDEPSFIDPRPKNAAAKSKTSGRPPTKKPRVTSGTTNRRKAKTSHVSPTTNDASITDDNTLFSKLPVHATFNAVVLDLEFSQTHF